MNIKKRIINLFNADVMMVLAYVITFAICIAGITYENSKSENDGETHYSTTVKDRAHGGFGYGIGYNIRTHRFGFGFGTGGINFH